MSEPQVLFLDGPLAGEWLDYARVGDRYVYEEVKYPTINPVIGADVLLDPLADHVYHAYVITKVVVFDHLLRVAHSGNEASRTAGLLEYLVPPDVRARLQPRPTD